MTSKKVEKKLQKVLIENKDVWKTEPEFFSWIRGGIRGRVMESPSC